MKHEELSLPIMLYVLKVTGTSSNSNGHFDSVVSIPFNALKNWIETLPIKKTFKR